MGGANIHTRELTRALLVILAVAVTASSSRAEPPGWQTFVGPDSAVSIRLDSRGGWGGGSQYLLSGDGRGYVTRRDRGNTESTDTLSFAPESIQPLLNMFFAAGFFDLPSTSSSASYIRRYPQGWWRVEVEIWSDVGQATLAVALGTYFKSVSFSYGRGATPMYLLALADSVRSFAGSAPVQHGSR